jgi:hypothetical protein
VWRGWVQHAATGETRYCHRLPDLLAFVETHTGPLAQTQERSQTGRGKERVTNKQTIKPTDHSHMNQNNPNYNRRAGK